VLYI